MNNRSKILKQIFFLTVVLFIVHFFSTVANLYWTTSWADILAHTIGGIIAGCIYIYIASFKKLNLKVSLYNILAFVFVVGFCWEIFELLAHFTELEKPGYMSDSISDLVFDIFGAYISYLFLTNSNHE